MKAIDNTIKYYELKNANKEILDWIEETIK